MSILMCLASRPSAAEEYLWPMHGERRLSSSFSEYRDGHYHAGIDIRSQGAIGLPCLAVSDGRVSRVRISPSGYGKALYLKLSDGRTAVYAHLDRFGDPVDSMMWHYRVEKKTSWCDLTFNDDRLACSVGDTVCFSGDTGTGAPHLHFELRDSMERPLNPLELVYTVPDLSAPMISGIEVVPLDKESLVEGAPFPARFLTRASENNSYVLQDTIHLEGRFGFGVSVFDEQGYGRYPMAPLSISLTVDGDTLYSMRNSLFSYDQSGEIALEFSIAGSGPGGRYTLLYGKEGNTRRDRSGRGAISSRGGSGGEARLAGGIHVGEITACDASGNESRALFYLGIGGQPVITEARRLDAADEVVVSARDRDGRELKGRLFESTDDGAAWSEVRLEKAGEYYTGAATDTSPALYMYEAADMYGAVSRAYFSGGEVCDRGEEVFGEMVLRAVPGGIRADIVTDRILPGDPVLVLAAAGKADTLALYRTGPRNFSAMAAGGRLKNGLNLLHFRGSDGRGCPVEIARAFEARIMSSGGEAEIAVDDSIRAVLEAPSVRGPVTVLTGNVPAPGDIPAGLISVGQPFILDFPGEALKRPFNLRLDPGRKTGLFRWEEGSGWRCVSVPAMEGGSSGISRPGIHIFMTDARPPAIASPALVKGAGGGTFFKPFFCSLKVTEEGSGIDPWSAEASINGRRMVCEWDGFRGRLVIPIPAFIEPGRAGLHVEVSDRAGNRTVGEFGFMIQ